MDRLTKRRAPSTVKTVLFSSSDRREEGSLLLDSWLILTESANGGRRAFVSNNHCGRSPLTFIYAVMLLKID